MNFVNLDQNLFSYLGVILIILFFLLGMKKNKNQTNNVIESESNKKVDIDLLKQYEKKLFALKELYKQELIDSHLYEKKIELISEKVEKILGKKFRQLPNFKQKIIMDSLKKDIKSKIKTSNIMKNETNIDNLIDAVDSRINKGKD